MTKELDNYLRDNPRVLRTKPPKRHPCGHECYPGAKPSDWCIECKYGDNPHH